MNNLDNIPVNILSAILNLIPLDEKLKCREVSRRFLYVIDNQTQKSLVVVKNKLFVSFRWFDDWKMVDLRNLILYQRYFGLFNSNLFKSRYFGNLKKFHIYYDGFRIDDSQKLKSLEFVNNFIKLETLKIAVLNVDLNIELRLNFLKNADVFLDAKAKLIFHLPKLEYLIANNFNNLQFQYLESIKRIQTDKDCQSNYEFIKKFTNLYQLNINLIRNLDLLIDLVEELNELKVLCIKTRSKEELDFSRLKTYADKNAIKVYVNGLLIRYWEKLKSLNDYYLLDSDKLSIYLDDSSAVFQDLSIISTIHYNSLELFTNIPVAFQDKLVNLVRIIVNRKVENESMLVNFLMKCERVKKLELIESSLDQHFYSRLYSYLPIVWHLIIQDDVDLVDKLDFGFLLELKELGTLKIGRHLDLQFIKELFMTLNYFIQIEFLFNGEYICIIPAYKSEFFKRTDNVQLKQFTVDLTNEYNQKYSFDDSDPFEFMAGNYKDYNNR